MEYFGTDGIRRKADFFKPDFLARIIKGLVNYAGDNIKVFLAGDTRESTEWILQDLATACETFGIEYSHAGILPTPAINYCFYEMGFDFAIDVTASHNPYTDNGIKVFERGASQGQKLSAPGREHIEQAITDSEFAYAPVSTTIREDLHAEALSLYQKHLLDYVDTTDFSHLYIGMDCANGATSVINSQIFTQLGAKVELIHCNPQYNTEINSDCGSTHLESLQNLVTTHHLDFGVAFDGDGDRCLCIDQTGEVVDGDQMLAFLSQFLKLDSIVTTVMANQGLLNWAKDHHIRTEITAVGDPNVVAAMISQNIQIGSEQNGHVILPGLTSGDGMLTGLMVAKAVASTEKPLHDLASIITKYPQIMVNLEASPEQKKSLKTKQSVKDLLLEYNTKLESVSGRLLVRPSGTENLIRVTMWGSDADAIDTLAHELQTKLSSLL